MVERATGRKRRAAWLLPSLGLHVALLGFGAWRHAHPSPAPSVSGHSHAELEVEMLEPPPPLVEAAEAPLPEATAAQSAPSEARASAARGTPVANAPTPVAGASTDEVAEEAPPAGVDAGDGAVEEPSRLSLGQLGVGASNPFFRRVAPDGSQAPPVAATARAAGAAEKAARVKRRLDRALAQGLMDQETARGAGAGSPVLRSLEAAVYASSAPLNGQASFVFIIDGDGKLLSSSVGNASGDREAWGRVARQTAQSLAQRKLTVPKGKSVRLTVAVSSHLELPSGADPGVAVDVLGIPLKKGSGPRSTKIDLLNPLAPLAPLSLLGDPANIGAKARRMVHAHVVSEELL